MASKKIQPAKPNYQGSLADYKASVKKPKTDSSEFNNEYFVRQGKAYVRLASSGDVMGPYSLRSAAGQIALGNSGGGRGPGGSPGNGTAGGGRGRFGGGGPLGRGK